MTEIKNCQRCKKIFRYSVGPQLCESCKRLDEEDFEKVRTFVREFPGATIQEVSRETEIATNMIYRYLKEGRLEVSESSPIALQCENCGVRIKSGRFCSSCTNKLANEMINVGQSLKERVDKRPTYDELEHGLRYIHGSKKQD